MPPDQVTPQPNLSPPGQTATRRRRVAAISVLIGIALIGGIGYGVSRVLGDRYSSPKPTPTPSLAPAVSSNERSKLSDKAVGTTDLTVTTLSAQSAEFENLIARVLQVTGDVTVQGGFSTKGGVTIAGQLAATSLVGNGSGVTNVDASLLGGQPRTHYEDLATANAAAVANLSANAVLRNAANTFSASNTFNGSLTATGTTILGATTISGLVLGSPLSASQGGTGLGAVPAQAILYGQGGPTLATAAPASSGLCLISGVTDIQWGSCAGGSGVATVNGQSGVVVIAGATGSGGTITIQDASTAQKGLAQFNATNFSVAAGIVNTAQNIATTSSPAFAGLTLSAPLAVTSGGIGAATLTANGVLLGNGTSAVSSVAAGSPGLCLVSGAGAPSWQACPGGGGVTGVNSQTGAVTIANASGSGGTITIDDASTAQKGLAQFNATNFSVSAGAVNTIQNIATTASPTFAGINTNTITPSAALTVGATSQSLTLQGSNTTLTATNGANVAQLTFVAPTASVTYRLQTAAAGTYDVCTTAGNCVGVGGSVSTSGGSANTIPKYTSASAIGPSLLTDDGTLVTVSGNLSVTGTASIAGALTLTTALTVGNGGTGATTAVGARTNLGAAASGANSDITSLSGLTTALSVLQGGTGATSLTAHGVLLGNGTSPISSLATATAGQCLISGGTGVDPSWQACPGGGAVASVNGQTGAVTIANASAAGGTITIDDATTAAKGIASFNATNFSVSGGAVNTIQNIATTASPTFAGINTNALTPSAALTVGATAQAFTLQGNASSTFTSTNAGATTTVGFATPTANITLNFPALSSGGPYDICTSSGNCAGAGGGVTTSGGTTGALARFTGAQTLGDSILSDDGSTVTIAGAAVVQGANGLTLGQASTATGRIVLQNATNANTLTLLSGATGSNLTLTLPVADGSNGNCLTTNGSGVLAFSACLSGAGGGSGGVASLNGLSGALTVANATAAGSTITINDASTAQKGIAQFNATNFTASSGVINTVQDIATTSTPRFTGIVYSGDNFLQTSSSNKLNSTTGIIIPFYYYPSTIYTDPVYNNLIALAKKYHNVPVTVILDPANGPGASTDPNYAAGISRLHGAGITVLGYVDTNNATVSQAAAEADIDTWLSLYPGIDGIFLDQMTNDANGAHYTYYANLTAYAHGKSLFPVVGNPGSPTVQGYFDNKTADNIIVHENTTYPAEATLAGDFAGGNFDYNYNRRSVLVHTQNFSYDQLMMMRKYAGNVYITDGVMPNPWNGLPTYLEQEFQALNNASESIYNTLAVRGADGLTLGAAGANNGGITFNSSNAGSASILLQAPTTMGATPRTITLPDASGIVCLDSGNCGVASGSGNYIQNQTSGTQSANFAIQSAGAGNPTAVIVGPASSADAGLIVRQGASQTGYLLQLQDSSSSPLVSFDSAGNVAVSNSLAAGSLVSTFISSANSTSGATSAVTIKSGDTTFAGAASGNVTVDAGTPGSGGTAGTVGIGTTNASALTIGRGGVTTTINGTLSLQNALTVGNGGTGLTSYTTGDLLYASGATALAALADVASGSCLLSGGIGSAPIWGSCGTGVATTLQQAYTNSGAADPQIQLSNANGGLKIRDAAGSTISSLLQVQNSSATETYLAVAAAGTTFTGAGAGGGTALTVNTGAASNQGLAINTVSSPSASPLSVNQTGVGHSAFAIDAQGRASFRPWADTSASFKVTNYGGTTTLLSVDSNTSSVLANSLAVGTGAAPNATLDVGGSGILLSGAGTQNFTLPAGGTTSTKINIPLYDPGAFGQVLALGVPRCSDSSDASPTCAGSSYASTTSRVILAADGRVQEHQPTIGVLSPNQGSIAGISWNGINSGAFFQTMSNSGDTADVALQSGNSTGNSATTGTVVIQSGNNTGTNSSSGNIVVDSGTATGTGTAGTVTIGGTNASALTIGRGGVTTTINGTLSLQSALTVGNGGTGATSLTANGVLIGNGTSAISSLATATSGQCLISGGTGVDPSWQACPGGGGVTGVNSQTGAVTIANATASGGTVTLDDATTAAKGIASFNSTNFTVSAGAVNTIQNIATTASPTFAGLTLSGAYLQRSDSASAFIIQNAAGTSTRLAFDATTNELRVYDAGSTAYASISYASGVATFAASSGTTQIGSGTGDVTINLANNSEKFSFTHTGTNATSTDNDFIVRRNLTGGANALAGNVLRVEDTSTFTSGSSAPNVLYINQNNTSATGNLIQAQTGGSTTKFQVSTAGTVTIASGASYTSTGALSVDSAAATALSLGAANANAVTLGNASGSTSVSVLCGTGACGFGNNAVAHTTTVGSTTGAASTTIQSGTGNLNITTQGTGSLNVGNNAVAQTINIGNGTGATTVSVLCGTGACGFGNNAVAHTTTVGSTTGAATTNIQGGTGGINIGTSAVAQAITIGNATASTTVRLGQNGGTIQLDGTNFDVGTTGQMTLLGGLNPDVTTAVTAGAGAALTIQPGTSTGASSNGAATTIKAGDGSGTTSVTGGALVLQGGSATGGSGTRNGGAVTIDAGTGATTNGAISIGATNAASLALGRTAAAFTLQGAATSTITATSGSFTTTVGFTVPTAARSISFPDAAGTICLDSSNCGNYIQNQYTSAQSANLYVQSASAANPTAIIVGPASSGDIGLVVRQGASQTGFLMQLQDSSLNPLVSFDSSGNGSLSNLIATNSVAAQTFSTVNSTTGATQNVTLKSGDTTFAGASSGSVIIDSGSPGSGGTGGQINIGNVNASSVLIGRTSGSSSTTTIQGLALVKPNADTTNVFRVQTTGGVDVLSVDTSGARLGVNTNAPATALEVVGDITSKGTSWNVRSQSTNNQWYGVAYGNGRFVTTAGNGAGTRAMYSSDGVNWITASTPTPSGDNSWSDLAYGNGLFVAVSKDGTNRVMTSPDGITWTVRASANDTDAWQSVTYGNGKFVAVACGVNTTSCNTATTAARTMSSPDGITWTLGSSTTGDAGTNTWTSVTYGNGRFIAVANDGTNRTMYSTDGVSWTAAAAAIDTINWNGVTYGNGTFVAVAGAGTGNKVMTSSDGTSWSSQASSDDLNLWNGVTYGAGLFVATAYNGTNSGYRIMTSPNGTTWTARTSPQDNAWLHVAYGNGVFVATANSGTNRIMTSGALDRNAPVNNNSYQGGMTIYGDTTIGGDSSATAFRVQNATGVNLFVADAANLAIKIGGGDVSADASPVLLVADHSTSASDPAGINGGMYYNETAGALRCYENGAWDFCGGISRATYGYDLFEDFLTDDVTSGSTGTHSWANAKSGTGSAVQKVATDTSYRPGIIRANTGTTTTGRSAVYIGDLTSANNFVIGGGETIETAIKIPTLSDGTDTYIARIGLCDSDTGDCSNGIYFEYDSTTSANWRIATANNSSYSKTTTSTAVGTGWTRLKIVVNSNATSVAFYINGTQVSGSPLTTTIPTGTTRTTAPLFSIIKSAGTTARTLDVDYYEIRNSVLGLR